jgi:predicted transcriptional regulator
MTEKPESEQLGELETAVMAVLWQSEHCDVNEVLERLEWDKPLAYTTIMTVMNRLVDKQFLERTRSGRKYLYTAVVKRKEAARTRFKKIVDGFYGGLTGLAVSELLGSEDDVSEDELDALEELVRRRRAEKSG